MSLTDDWKARKLKAGAYYVRLSNGNVDVAKLSKYNRFYAICCTLDVIEVLAPCDYAEIATLYAYYKEAQRMCGDYMKKNTRLESDNRKFRQLLKECKPYIQKEMETIKGAGFCNCDWAWKTSDLLTRINEVLNG